MFLPKIKKPSTFLKYLLSYILVFAVLMAAFFLILRFQIAEVYSTQRTVRIQSQMEAVRDHLREEFLFLAQIDRLVVKNPDIVLSASLPEGKHILTAAQELLKYDGASKLISNIVFYSHHTDYLFSSLEYITYADGIFTLSLSPGIEARFDVAPYMDSNSEQLIWVGEGQAKFLIYFPSNSSVSKYIFFYILDTQTIQSQLQGLLSEEVPGVALLDAQGNYVTGSGFEPFASEIADIPLTPGVHPLTKNYSLFRSDDLFSGFSMAAVVSEDHVTNQVSLAYVNSSLSLLALSILGILVVYVAMLFTYRPLHRFVRTVIREPGKESNYLELLRTNYSNLTGRNLQLQKSLAGYREFVHKSILGSLLTQQYSLNPGQIDQIFEYISRAQKVMAVKIPESKDKTLLDRVVQQLKAAADARSPKGGVAHA